jgi:sec-independent protein translocase protein TatB
MPSFPDSIFLFVLALLLFGPKRLPVLARELGKWVGEFRRASNEFKMQMEEELRLSEQTERNKQIAAMEAAAPVAPVIAEPEPTQLAAAETATEVATEGPAAESTVVEAVAETGSGLSYGVRDGVREPLPIATSGELKVMPPATGLPTAQVSSGARNSALTGLLDAIPAAPENPTEAAPAEETTAHGN